MSDNWAKEVIDQVKEASIDGYLGISQDCCGYDREEIEEALGVQVGGDHYKTKAIQPVQYCMANNIGFMEGSVIKYVTRWRDKGGVEDLKKARHFLDMLIEAQ